MLIWESAAAGAKVLRALASRASGAVQLLAREDSLGSLVLCDRGSAPQGVLERRVTELFSSGRVGPRVGNWVFRVGINVPKAWRSEFCAWYKCEHGPILLECSDWEGFQFMEEPSNRGCQFYVLHYLAERDALDSEWRRFSRSTPWFKRLARNKWFDKPFERVLSRRVNINHRA